MTFRLVDRAKAALEESEYSVRVSSSLPDSVEFESPTLLGFLSSFPTVAGLLAAWEQHQAAFVNGYRHELHKNPMKAWNVYAVLVTEEPSAGSQAQALRLVSEDFSISRKIVADGVATELALRRALAPLLPIRATSAGYHLNSEASLTARLASPAQHLLKLVGDTERSDREIADWLMEEAP